MYFIELIYKKFFAPKNDYIKQEEKSASHTSMIRKEQAKIDWNLSAIEVVNTIRAFNPAPIAYTIMDGQPLKIFKAKVSCGKGNAGEVISLDGKFEIACGENSILVERLQKAGGNPMDANDFLRGCRLKKGDILG